MSDTHVEKLRSRRKDFACGLHRRPCLWCQNPLFGLSSQKPTQVVKLKSKMDSSQKHVLKISTWICVGLASQVAYGPQVTNSTRKLKSTFGLEVQNFDLSDTHVETLDSSRKRHGARVKHPDLASKFHSRRNPTRVVFSSRSRSSRKSRLESKLASKMSTQVETRVDNWLRV